MVFYKRWTIDGGSGVSFCYFNPQRTQTKTSGKWQNENICTRNFGEIS